MTFPLANPLRRSLLLALCLALAGCSGSGAGGEGNETDQVSPNAGYLAPPTPTSASRRPDGGVQLRGTAPAAAQVRLASPDGAAFGAMAGTDGAWTLELPPAEAPRMFAVSAEASGETLRGEGALIVLPGPAVPALLARSGFGAVALGPAPGKVQLVALDYDGGGGTAVAGLAQPNTEVRLTLDDAPAGIGQTDAAGRFAILAPNRRLASGAHSLSVEARSGVARRDTVVILPQPLTTPFRATRQPGAWRVDWRLPGGGVQTTLVFDVDLPARP